MNYVYEAGGGRTDAVSVSIGNRDQMDLPFEESKYEGRSCLFASWRRRETDNGDISLAGSLALSPRHDAAGV